jgi:hypothetical protein
MFIHGPTCEVGDAAEGRERPSSPASTAATPAREQDEDRGPGQVLRRHGRRVGERRDVQQRLGQLEQLAELAR